MAPSKRRGFERIQEQKTRKERKAAVCRLIKSLLPRPTTRLVQGAGGGCVNVAAFALVMEASEAAGTLTRDMGVQEASGWVRSL